MLYANYVYAVVCEQRGLLTTIQPPSNGHHCSVREQLGLMQHYADAFYTMEFSR